MTDLIMVYFCFLKRWKVFVCNCNKFIVSLLPCISSRTWLGMRDRNCCSIINKRKSRVNFYVVNRMLPSLVNEIDHTHQWNKGNLFYTIVIFYIFFLIYHYLLRYCQKLFLDPAFRRCRRHYQVLTKPGSWIFLFNVSGILDRCCF